MDLVIKYENGLPVNHPILLENLKQCYPDLDINNLPDEYKIFKRVPKPVLGLFQVFIKEEPEYRIIDGIAQDVWLFRDMTPWEKQEAIDIIMEQKPYESWILNDNYVWEAPIPKPEDGNAYIWDESAANWILLQE